MKRLLCLAMISVLTGCAILSTPQFMAGDSEADVLARMGNPTHRYQEGADTLLEYTTGPYGQRTYMARIGPDKRVISFEQVLVEETIAKIRLNESRKNDVLKTIGAPSMMSYLSLPKLEVWSYPYKQQNVWNSLLHVHFDNDGVVRRMESGPDPRFEPDVRVPLGVVVR